jgi:hypothetical protein
MEYLLKLIILMVPIIGFLVFFSQKKRLNFVIPAILYLSLLIAVSLLNIGSDIYRNYSQPPEWDFLVFWLDGNIGASGENFYMAESYQAIPLPFEPSAGFREEILDVGFKYPPPSMFLFLPLALFDLSNAYLFWEVLILLFCLASIYGMWRIFLGEHGILGLVLIAALLLRLSPTRDTFTLAQTNFLVMFFFLMFWANRAKPSGGPWLALCIVVKPYMALLLLYSFLTRKWGQLTAAIASLAVLTGVSAIAFGTDVVLSFINNPTSKVPDFLYTEIVNQSLLATILRFDPSSLENGSPLTNPLFVALSLIITLITVFVTTKYTDNKKDEWAVLSLLFLALIVYPATLEHYSVFLIIPTALLLQKHNHTVLETLGVLTIVFIAYLLSGYNESGDYSFYANAFMWVICIAFASRLRLAEALRSPSKLEEAS